MHYVAEDILTAKELAAKLKWDKSTVYRANLPMLKKGRGRGRTYYWPDVLEHLRQQNSPHGGSR